MPQVKKLIIPAAGFGTRLRPLTYHTPKALLPLGGKPLLGYLLDEARSVNIREIGLIIHPFFQKKFKDFIKPYQSQFKFSLIIQKNLLGTGYALYLARNFIGSQGFVLRFPDDIFLSGDLVLKNMISCFYKYKSSILGVSRVSKSELNRYGIVRPVLKLEKDIYQITELKEKPHPAQAPSNLASFGIYILTSQIISHLSRLAPYAPQMPDSLNLASGINIEAKSKRGVLAFEMKNKRIDCGTLSSYLKAKKSFKIR